MLLAKKQNVKQRGINKKTNSSKNKKTDEFNSLAQQVVSGSLVILAVGFLSFATLFTFMYFI